MGCLYGCLMSSASIQKLFCGICSAFKCSLDEFVGEKVVSLSYSSAILGPPPTGYNLKDKGKKPTTKILIQQDSHSDLKEKLKALQASKVKENSELLNQLYNRY